MRNLVFDLDMQANIVTGHKETLPNIERILKFAAEQDILIAGTTYYDCYQALEKLPETVVVDEASFYNVPITHHGIDTDLAHDCGQVYFEKSCLDIWNVEHGQPDNLNSYLRTSEVGTVFIVGHNYLGSLRVTVEGFIRMGHDVVIIEDAMSGINNDLIDTMSFLNGVQFLSTHDVFGDFNG